jgi:uncharacterized protein
LLPSIVAGDIFLWVHQWFPMEFDGFDWDEGNWPKCGKHGLSKQEIENIFEAPISLFDDLFEGYDERRLRAVGLNAEGRHVFIVFCVRQRNGRPCLRPISARYMHAKEIGHFKRQQA